MKYRIKKKKKDAFEYILFEYKKILQIKNNNFCEKKWWLSMDCFLNQVLQFFEFYSITKFR